jgi:hypothetical protein
MGVDVDWKGLEQFKFLETKRNWDCLLAEDLKKFYIVLKFLLLIVRFLENCHIIHWLNRYGTQPNDSYACLDLFQETITQRHTTFTSKVNAMSDRENEVPSN